MQSRSTLKDTISLLYSTFKTDSPPSNPAIQGREKEIYYFILTYVAAFLCCLLHFICHCFKPAHSLPSTWFLYSSVPHIPLSPACLVLPRSPSHMPSSIVLSPHTLFMNHLINQSINHFPCLLFSWRAFHSPSYFSPVLY